MRRGRWAFRSIPQFEVAQDFLDDGVIIDEADNFERAAATGTHQGVRFVDLLNKPRPRASYPANEVGLRIGGRRRPGR